MNRPSLRWLAGAALAGMATAVLVAPTAHAAPAPELFCDLPGQELELVPQDEVHAMFSADPTAQVTGRTVVKGSTPTGFTGTYVGRIEDALGRDAAGRGVDMLLFELSGAGIDSGPIPAGIWAGMSGSPVYDADGRLIGAVAYGLTPANGPVAGVTPAAFMKETGTDKTQGAPARVNVTPRTLDRVGPKAVTGAARRLKTVKVMAGGQRVNEVANRTAARIPGRSATARSLQARDFAAVGAPRAMAEPLVAGGNIAVGYSTGDIFAGSVGTVTAVCGDDVWAFGHPMDGAGATSLSMHNASTALIARDDTGQLGSYKQVSVVGEQVGTITEDGFAALRGRVGLMRGFPTVTTVKNAAGKVLDTYSGSVVDPASATNAAVAPAVATQNVLDNIGTGTARLSWTIEYRLPGNRHGRLSNTQLYASSPDLADEVAGDLGDQIAQLTFTDLADVTITKVTSTLTVLDRRAVTHRIAGAQVLKGRTWVNLRGQTLRKNTTHSVRPMYRQYVNGKPKTLVAGTPHRFTMGRLAHARGSVTFAPRGAVSGRECFEVAGQKICVEFGDEDDEEQEFRTFAELVASLDGLRRADTVQAVTQWTWKARTSTGVSTRRANGVAPGVVTGQYKATFRVKR